ncbi:TonB-dependent receptor [Flectobacillus rivi]|uniref:TonB-dependent receptor n=1 Tax=Flectobacillus rivi TaxID=2984209 RepID=A0ABT6YVV0_9BACT|nr:TonB-dependent receptor [Flectobacillus rivi]MDI9872989.1 TonB-dependent receptor [Flectobacillus rivi]
MKTYFRTALLILVSFGAWAQTSRLTGKFVDAKGEALIGVNVVLTNPNDAKDKHFGPSDVNGRFIINRIPLNTTYQLKATIVGYKELTKSVTISKEFNNLGDIVLQESTNELNEVVVKGKAATMVQKGDTLQYNANAFKTAPDANADELVKKLPGITVENGQIKAQGENVAQVLVDGKPFFGDDPNIALKNLPAELIDKIEIMDRLSDQSQLTGFNDGNTTKTINIVTNPNRRNGQFGKIYAGLGTNDNYTAGGNINLFNGEKRWSIVGMSNNINQQNFSSQDLLGISSSGGGGGGNRGGGGGNRGGGNFGSSADNFLVGQQTGINTTNSFGVNYTDNWGKKLAIKGSYFFNNSNNNNTQSTYRTYFLSQAANQYYDEQSNSSSNNYNHRLNLRLEYTIDPKNTIIFTPRLNLQNNNSTSIVDGLTTDATNQKLNQTSNNTTAKRTGYTFNNDILYRHSFAKRGRSVSLNLSTALNDRNANSNLVSNNQYFTSNTSSATRQISVTDTKGYTLSANLVYTEPIGKGLLQGTYNVSFNNNKSDKVTNKFNPTSNEYSVLDSLLSNKFDNDYLTHRAGLGYNLRMKNGNLNLGANYQSAELSGQQLFPRTTQVETSFQNVLPYLQWDYRFTQDSRIRFNYRTSTNAPSITQLQNVLDNTNPLFLTSGNPNLAQEYSHNLNARYTYNIPAKALTFMLLGNFGYTKNPIGNEVTIAQQDMIIDRGVTLRKGAQLTRPINFDNSLNMRSFMVIGFPLSFIKTNVNLTSSYNYSKLPGKINNQLNNSNQYNFNQGITFASNISTNIDFNLTYNLGYNQVDNTLQPQLNTKYYVHTGTGRLNLIFGKGFVFQSDLSYYRYNGLSDSFNQQFILWNMSAGKKFLKNQRAEAKITVFDVLKKNNSITRTVTDTYIADVRSNVLTQYFMLTFTYNIRNFKGNS